METDTEIDLGVIKDIGVMEAIEIIEAITMIGIIGTIKIIGVLIEVIKMNAMIIKEIEA